MIPLGVAGLPFFVSVLRLTEASFASFVDPVTWWYNDHVFLMSVMYYRTLRWRVNIRSIERHVFVRPRERMIYLKTRLGGRGET